MTGDDSGKIGGIGLWSGSNNGVQKTLKRGIVVAAFLSFLLAVMAVPVTAAEEGELTVDVKHENGNQASEVNALIIYKDNNVYGSEKAYPSVDLENTFSNLEASGTSYRVDVYINDQYAGTTGNIKLGGFLNPAKKDTTVTVSDPVSISPTVFYQDGETPLEGATVKVSSHEDMMWRSSSTTADGRTDSEKLWLFPTDQGSYEDGQYYRIEVEYNGNIVATKKLDSLSSHRTVDITTDVPVPTYDLSVSASPSDGGDVDAAQTESIHEGTSVDVTASADQGYEFSHWSGDYPSGARDDRSIAVTMNENKDLTANFDKKKGDLTIDVEHQNGNRANEVNSLVVWQGSSSDGDPFKKFEQSSLVDIPQKIHDLPGGHEYKVNAFIHDQFAGTTGWVSIQDSDVSETIYVEDPVWVKPTIYYKDGETPLEDAKVKIKSHEGTTLRSASTNENGHAIVKNEDGKLWLYPTGDKGEYTLTIRHDGELVARQDFTELQSEREIKITTSASLPTTDTLFRVTKQSSVEGYSYSGEPVKSATVEIAGKKGQTDSEGELKFQLPQGKHELTVTASGFETVTDTVDISESGLRVVNVPMIRADAGVLELDIVDQRGDPIAANKYQVLVDGEEASLNAQGQTMLDQGQHSVSIKPTEFGTENDIVSTSTTVDIRAGKYTHETLKAARSLAEIGKASISVLTVNGDQKRRHAFDIKNSIRQMRLKITYPDGQPVTEDELYLHTESDNTVVEKAELTHQGKGVYLYDDNFFHDSDKSALFFFEDLYFSASVGPTSDESIRSQFTIPIDSAEGPLRAPLKNVGASESREVVVDGSQYKAVRTNSNKPLTSDAPEHSDAYVIFDSSGKLVEDPEIVEKAALTAMVAEETSGMGPDQIQYLKQKHPRYLQDQLGKAETASLLVTVRDTSAKMIGVVASGGSSIATESSIKAATKQTAKTVAKKVVKEHIKKQLPQDVKEDPLGATEKAIKTEARLQITQAAQSSKEMGELVEKYHENNEKWQYEDAKEYWRLYEDAFADGFLYLSMRVNMLPDADAQSQLQDVAVQVAEGGTGAPVSDLTSYIVGGQLGYISEAVEDTAELRAEMNAEERTYTEYTEIVQQQAIDKYANENFRLHESTKELSKSAEISIVSAPSGEYVKGDTATVKVEITNHDDNHASRFFVGYSAITEVNGKSRYFDNFGSTGHYVNLAPGESKITEVEWQVQPNAPANKPYDALVALWPEYPKEGVHPIDEDRAQSAFSVAPNPDITIEDIELADSQPVTGKVYDIRATVSNDESFSTSGLLGLRINGKLVSNKVVDVEPESSAVAVFTHRFNEPGEHTISINTSSNQDSTSVYIGSPAEFDVEISSTNSPVRAGEQLNMTATVKNTGDIEEIKSVDLTIPSVGSDSKQVTIPGGGSRSVSFGVPTQSGDSGKHTATVEISSDQASTPVSIDQQPPSNTPPTPDFTYSPSSPQPSKAVSFTDQSSDPDGTIQSYEWSFGDGATSAQANPTHVYRSDGTYNVTLTVTDDDGQKSITHRKISVGSTRASPAISEFTLSNPSETKLKTWLVSNQSLAEINTKLTNENGDVVADLTRDQFKYVPMATTAVVGSSDAYGYKATVDVGQPGTYTATLDTAANDNGMNGATGQRATATVGGLTNATVALNTSDRAVSPGDTLTVDICVDPDDAAVYGGQAAIDYNTSVLNVTAVDSGALLSSDGANTFVTAKKANESTGAVNYGESRQETQSGITQAGTLAEVTFRVRENTPAFTETDLSLSATLSDPSESEINTATRGISLQQQPVRMNVTPANTTGLTPGDTFTKRVQLNTAGQTVYASQATLTYDTALLDVANVSQGALLSVDGAETFISSKTVDEHNGTISYAESRRGTQQGAAGNTTLFTVTFRVAEAAQPGSESPVSIPQAIVSTAASTSLPIDTTNGSAHVPANMPPTVNVSTISSVNNVGSPIHMNLTVTDQESAVTSVQMLTQGEPQQTVPCEGDSCAMTVSITPTESTWNASSDRYATTTLTVKATDAHGANGSATTETKVYIAGDTNGDGVVNIFDAVAIGKSWQTQRGSTAYSDSADLNNDGTVNIFDAVAVGKHWQETA